MTTQAEIERERAELLAQLRELEEQDRKSGRKQVQTSDISSKGWDAKVLAAIAKVDKDAATDPALRFWFDADRGNRVLMIRRGIYGDKFTGKGVLPHGKINDEAALEKAISDALKEADHIGRENQGRGIAMSKAEHELAIERAARKKSEEALRDQLAALEAKMSQLLSGGQVAPPPQPEPQPPSTAPEPPAEPAEEAAGKPAAVPSAFAPKPKRRGRQRKS